MSYVNFHSINHIERCGNTTSPPPSHPPGALNINKLFRKWALGKEIAEIQTKRFPLSLRNWHLTKKNPPKSKPTSPKNSKHHPPHSPTLSPRHRKANPPHPQKKKSGTVWSANCCRITSFLTNNISLNISTEAYAFTFVVKLEMGSLRQSPGFFFLIWIFLSGSLVRL